MEPGFLISSPQMQDGNFARTVVLLVHHNEDGALGLVVNRPHQVRLGEVSLPGTPRPSLARQQALWGGPVEPSVGFVIFRGRCEEGWELPGGIAVSASRDRLSSLLASGAPFHLCLGYSGWGKGQLDLEFESGSWVYTEASPDLVFGCPAEQCYDLALAKMGLSASSLWMTPVDE